MFRNYYFRTEVILSLCNIFVKFRGQLHKKHGIDTDNQEGYDQVSDGPDQQRREGVGGQELLREGKLENHIQGEVKANAAGDAQNPPKKAARLFKVHLPLLQRSEEHTSELQSR